MEKLSIQCRISLVRCFYQSGNSPVACLRLYSRENGLREFICCESTIRRLIKRFEETGSVQDASRSGRPRVSEEDVDIIQNSVTEIQQTTPMGTASISQISRATDMPESTVRKVLREYLHYYPYRVRKLHELKECDHDRRLRFANWFLERNSEDPTFIEKIVWSDEAHFTVDGTVYTHQCIVWSPFNTHASVTTKLYPERVTVWCGFSSEFIIGPFFFEENVTSDRYLKMIKEFLIPQLKQKRAFSKAYFQQDGATPHTASVVRDFLTKKFQGRVIGSKFENDWPARSPDLAPPDYWLWGTLKGRVYQRRPKSIPEQKDVIRDEISKIKTQDLQNAVQNLLCRLNGIVHSQGGHIEQLMS